ncbi:acyl-CoA thioester hydrolase/BAAT C-terminal domain-containing protein [Kordiimonas aquimaris]|uniref:acyl-CoA thioester hydrolase/BAAT C-terminal domain-containing protein n=1 Tax=Kordiimonas aquimaris TaxID=707591 RepID=UPI0021D24B74|nr:acyl-CoA thioester hydrolase/BAAT C-terminal domain-containing protein [Kordiimonas aquimaris]
MDSLRMAAAVCICVWMSFGASGADFKPVSDDRFVADYTAADGPVKYGVLVLGGSGGGKPEPLADKIADMGYSVLSLAYFKAEGLPAELNEIPLEYFDAPKKWLLDQKETRSDGLIVVGWSKGAELALLLASHDSSYKGVVGIAPSHVVWAGILSDWTKTPSSSWTKDGEPLPHVPFAKNVQINSLVDLYAASLEQVDLVADATIKTENIEASVMLFSGGKDEIWPASEMADTVCQRMGAVQKSCVHHAYPEAGHLLDEDIIIGGTEESNAAANADSKVKIKAFLSQLP